MPTRPKPEPARPLLRVARETARERIDARIVKGTELRDLEIPNKVEFDRVQGMYYTWDEGNTALIRSLFTTDELANDYSFFGAVGGTVTLDKEIMWLRRDIETRIRRLEGVIEKLEFIDEVPGVGAAAAAIPQPAEPTRTGNRVFVVHGRDAGRLRTVEAYLRQLGLDVTVLADRASEGDTVIEKIERYGDVDYVVALATPDDVGGLWNEAEPDALELKPRARENVIFELGYFSGRLGRGKVAALVVGTPLPSDLGGFVTIRYDAEEGWKVKLIRELTAAKVPVDHSKM